MASDAKKRQRKLEKRAAHRKSKQLELTRERNAGLPERLRSAATCPIVHCWVSNSLWTNGLGWVCLSRRLPNGLMAFSVFLVDRYCLGVKNAMVEIVPPAEYDERVERGSRRRTATQPISPEAARKLVEKAVSYASALGFHPHPDYHKARLIFGTIDYSRCAEEFEFGQDGQPMFISGPHDSMSRCRQIMKTLERSCGQGNFHYTIHASDIDELETLDAPAEPAPPGYWHDEP